MDEIITPKEFAEKMEEIRRNDFYDYEAAHSKMDNLMSKVLRQNGYKDGILCFNKQQKWYS